MEVFVFQIIIFGIIFFSSFSGRRAVNLVSLIICVFTFLAIFTTWLMILQFVTIFVSYSIAVERIKNSENSIQSTQTTSSETYNSETQSKGCAPFITIFIIIISIYCAFNVWSKKNLNNDIPETEPTIETENNNSNSDAIIVDPNSFVNVDTVSAVEDTTEIQKPSWKIQSGSYLHFTSQSCDIEYARLIIDRQNENDFNFIIQTIGFDGSKLKMVGNAEIYNPYFAKYKGKHGVISFTLENEEFIKVSRSYEDDEICIDAVFRIN